MILAGEAPRRLPSNLQSGTGLGPSPARRYVADNHIVLQHYVEQALQKARIRPSRARGQNFLIDDTVLAEIIRAAELTGEELVVEVGPGLGTLTQSLASRCFRLHAFELDDHLVRYLRGYVLPELRNVVLHDAAFNKYVYEPVAAEAEKLARPLKIVTNLPYQISSAFLHFVVEYLPTIDLVVVMLQREMAQRVVAHSGDPGYSSFSLYLQTFLKAGWVCDVPRSAFMPEPKVDSAVITLRALPQSEQPQPGDRELYLKLIEGVFRRRRKQLVNALQQTFSHLSDDAVRDVLQSAGISHTARAQEVDMAGFVRLADALAAHRG